MWGLAEALFTPSLATDFVNTRQVDTIASFWPVLLPGRQGTHPALFYLLDLWDWPMRTADFADIVRQPRTAGQLVRACACACGSSTIDAQTAIKVYAH